MVQLELLIFFSCLFLPATSIWAQGDEQPVQTPVQRPVLLGERKFNFSEQDTFRTNPYGATVALEFGYASASIKNLQDWAPKLQKDRKPYRVDIIYSRYPRDTAQWLTPYMGLMRRRVDSLIGLDGRLAAPEIEWNLIAHGTCTSDSCARKLFHGAYIYYDVLESLVKDAVRFDGTVDREAIVSYNMGKVKAWVAGRDTFTDSLVYKTLDQHPEWGRLLVVVDWTASMYSFGAEVLHWYGQRADSGRIAGLVLYNDGDDFLHPDQPKPIGQSGGIYQAPTDDPFALFLTMDTIMRRGDGGEVQENDIEALLFAVEHYDTSAYDQIILIADNGGAPRDTRLMVRLKRPVHVILCRAKNRAPHPDYLTLAWRTGGSVLTIEDAINFSEHRPQAASKYQLGGAHYYIDERGFFRWTEPPPGW